MVMEAILTGILKNPQKIDDGVCYNFINDPDSFISKPIFRTTYLGKIVIDDDLNLFRFCNMGEKCYQPKCSFSNKFVAERGSIVSVNLQNHVGLNEILEKLFEHVDIHKEGNCWSYMQAEDSLPSEKFREIFMNKISHPHITPVGRIKIKIFYMCSVRDNCDQPNCSWSYPSYLESLRHSKMKRLEPYATVEGIY